MTADEEKPTAAPQPKMQFSLGTLLLLPVIAGCAMAVMFTKPPSIAAVELLVIEFLLPSALTAGIIYTTGYKRAFCIGALLPVGPLWIYCVFAIFSFASLQTWDLNANSVNYQWVFGGSWLASVISGCVCLSIRWLALSSNAADGSARRHGWGRAILIALFILLVLSGPIIGRIGISVGWWKADTPQSSATGAYYMPGSTRPVPYSVLDSSDVIGPSADTSRPPQEPQR
jgi:hypothetical protein